MTLRAEVEAFIERRLRDPDLDVRQIAAAHYVSPRTLYRLFDGPGESVAGYIRGRRLDRCRREILARPDLPLVAICGRWGMGDPKHFARKYRARFGQSPQETRLQAWRQLGTRPCAAGFGWLRTAGGAAWPGCGHLAWRAGPARMTRSGGGWAPCAAAGAAAWSCGAVPGRAGPRSWAG